MERRPARGRVDRDAGSAGDAGGDKSHVTASTKKKANKTWFDRDSLIAGALRSHQILLRATKAETQHLQQKNLKASPLIDIADDVKNEKKLC